MIRNRLTPILVLATLFLVAGASLPAREPKEVRPTAVEDPATPKATPNAATGPKGAPKTAKESSKGGASSTKAPKVSSRKMGKPTSNYNVGEAPGPVKATPKPPKPKPSARKKAARLPYDQRVNINAATKEELMKLPGISEAEAAKIIAHRPYKSKAGLAVDAGLTGAQYFAIKDRVAAGKSGPR